MLLNPVFLPYFALLNAAFSPNATTLVTPSTLTLHNIVFRLHRVSSTQLALKNTVILGATTATAGTILALVIAYVTTRRAIRGYRVWLPCHRAGCGTGIMLGVGLFLSYTRPPFSYGTLWILLIAFPHHQPAIGPISNCTGGVRDHPSELEGCQPHPRRYPAAIAAPDHRAAAADRCDRDLVLYLHRRDARTLRGDRAVHVADQR